MIGSLGFKVPDGSPAIRPAEISAAARERMLHVIAAAVGPTNSIPEDIVLYQQNGWPEEVTALLALPSHRAEISAYVDLLAAELAAA